MVTSSPISNTDTSLGPRFLSDISVQKSGASFPGGDYTLTTGERQRHINISGKSVIAVGWRGSDPLWLQTVLNFAAELLRLPEGWNSYNARPINKRRIADALYLLSDIMPHNGMAPDLVPTN